MFYRILLFLGLNILVSQSFLTMLLLMKLDFNLDVHLLWGRLILLIPNTSVATLRNPARLSFINKSGNNKLFGSKHSIRFLT